MVPINHLYIYSRLDICFFFLINIIIISVPHCHLSILGEIKFVIFFFFKTAVGISISLDWGNPYYLF